MSDVESRCNSGDAQTELLFNNLITKRFSRVALVCVRVCLYEQFRLRDKTTYLHLELFIMQM